MDRKHRFFSFLETPGDGGEELARWQKALALRTKGEERKPRPKNESTVVR
ncbi:hypothetical protein D187_005289 [Cystobacter fuscus DSM 2262]|uniref:Uncharacterized protein n=1 Tax=Cystobacter fuscus (strain ATCC 25194 / DSM 2262 / NBRC 100088 / M29) TaxID=1242864 RepID=S9PIM3_CYSF2|nr:hypothetical protein D187_005289 [Cystobacter fuscus DSM 2262]